MYRYLKRNKFLFVLSILLISFCFTACGSDISKGINADSVLRNDTDLSIHYIDVGQGDSELICFNDGEVMLIDTGTNENSSSLINYLNSQNVEKIDYMVLTHPHEDHIGGACAVLNNFTVKNAYLPKIDENMVPTTRTYEKTLEALINKQVNVIEGKAGTDIKTNENTSAQIIGPNSEGYDDLNNYSIVIKLTHKNKSFLFMGDAQNKSEKEIFSKYNLKADVLKCGHHGSRTSTGKEFIKRVAPSYVIISCGKNNRYGHPHEQTLKKLENAKVKVYRTDLNGNIVINLKDQEMTIKTEK